MHTNNCNRSVTRSQDRYIIIYDGSSRDYLGGELIYPRSDCVEKHIVIAEEGETGSSFWGYLLLLLHLMSAPDMTSDEFFEHRTFGGDWNRGARTSTNSA